MYRSSSIYVVLITKRKLLHYFGQHPMVVVTSFVLGYIINNHNSSGRISKWALKFMGFNITYVLCTTIKSQVRAVFVVECLETQSIPAPIIQEFWTM